MEWTQLFTIALGAILVNNFIVAQFLGICLHGVSKKIETASGMGLAVIFVMGLASAICWPINELILVPMGLTFMQTVTYILVIASLVQFIEMFLKKAMPSLYEALVCTCPDHHQLRCAGRGAAERAEQLQLHFLRGLRYYRRPGLPAGHRAVRQHSGAAGVCGLSQGV